MEQGSHSELMALQGHYFSLVNADPTLTEGEFYLGNGWLGNLPENPIHTKYLQFIIYMMREWHNETAVCDNTV